MTDVHRLRVLRSFVAAGSVHGAATSLGYTPSAISQHLAALQRETGLTLVRRAGRGLRPTAAGLALADEADELLARLARTEARIADLRDGRSGTLSIEYFASVGSAWLPGLVRRLGGAFPDLRLDLRLAVDASDRTDTRADLRLLVHRDADLAPEAGFTAHHLLDEPYVAVVPKGHVVADRERVALQELAAERWIDNDLGTAWCRRILLDACAAAGFSPLFHVEAHDYRTAVAFAAAGVGITVVPEIGAADAPAGVAIRTIAAPAPTRSIHAVVRDDAAHLPAVALALDLLRHRAAAKG